MVSGVSPFVTSSSRDDETTRANVILNKFEFVPELFENVSEYVIEFVRNILVLDMKYI